MANIEDCPGFETFGADVKAARQAKRVSRKAMAEKINIDWRYLANIENDGPFPVCRLSYSLLKPAGFLWNATLTRRSCGRKANCGKGSATS
ncbi:Helix-turn-helix domain protein [Enterococcus faecium]|nr:Helix-turn-helix domain protein [Enterococcus faecium]SAM38905.1 Helix-turn-helix domain protein [Enterococcus faecium]SAM43169.1 Helix-turn-helix domain protein [Enterococcus faecium]SAM43885.1 Helix-turn-helix domain protein [Enterococcus faecium]SAM67146.1 Helix-turn-helix domain protein [Enterococcus faecium]